MNLLQQLTSANKCAPQMKRVIPEYLLAAARRGSSVQRERTMAKYEALLIDWMSTTAVRKHFGFGLNTGNSTLLRYLALGLVERRPAGGKAKLGKDGWEWRWVK